MSDTSPVVSIGIVTWNSKKRLRPCLESIRGQSLGSFEVIIVDNGSTDDSFALASSLVPQAHVVRNNKNEGFCRAHNQAIRASRGEFYLALNPDVVLSPDYLDHLVGALRARPLHGSAAGKLIREGSGKEAVIDSTGLFLDRRRHQYLRGYGARDEGQYDREGEVFGVDGAAPLYRRDMLEDVAFDGEYFDETFFVHKEDVDLAWRARLRGWGCWYVPSAVAVHPRTFRPGVRAAIPKATRMHAVKNRYLMILKNESAEGWRRDAFRILAYDLRVLGYILLFEWSSLEAAGLLRSCLPRARAWRNRTFDRVKVEARQMLEWFA